MARTAQAIELKEKPDVGLKRERKQVEIDEALTELHERRGRVLPAELLVEAQAEEHPLHKYFEWDDSVAAQKYRLTQAHAIIIGSRMAEVYRQQGDRRLVVEAEPTQVRRLVNAFAGEGYRMRNDVLADTDERKALVEKKLSILRGWCREAADIEELARLRTAILGCLPAFEPVE